MHFPPTPAGDAAGWFVEGVRDATLAADYEARCSDEFRAVTPAPERWTNSAVSRSPVVEIRAVSDLEVAMTRELPDGTRVLQHLQVESAPPHRVKAIWSLPVLPDGASATAVAAASLRAYHRLVDSPPVFDDLLAEPLLGGVGRLMMAGLAATPPETHRSLRTAIAARSRFAEVSLREAVERTQIRQCVVLGAGLDTLAYREDRPTDVRFFELDLPASQRWKVARLVELGVAHDHVEFVEVDLSTATPADALAHANGTFDAAAAAFVSWLGVSYYVDREAAESTCRALASMAPGTQVVFDYFLPRAAWTPVEEAELPSDLLAAGDEPLRSFFTDEEVRTMLSDQGYATVEIAEPSDVVRAAGSDVRPFRPLRLVRATTGPRAAG